MLRQKFRLFLIIVLTVGHQMFLWLFQKSTQSILKLLNIREKDLVLREDLSVLSLTVQSRATHLLLMHVKEFGPKLVVATTYQAISGAGKTFEQWPEMVENIIPYIGGEEEKSEKEPLRLWGKIEDGKIVPASDPVITCQCIRVPVLDGHTAAVFVNFEKKPTKEQIIEKWRSFKGVPQELNLPSAPKQFIQYLEEDDRPQVKLDVNL